MKLARIQTCQPHRGHIDVCHTYDVYNLIEFKRRINAMRTVKEEEEKHTDTHKPYSHRNETLLRALRR